MSANKTALGHGLFGADSQATVDVYLNLTPLMDVMSNILFFLLAAFGASAVAVLSVTVPVESPLPAAAGAAQDKVIVTLRADAGGLSLGCQDESRLPEDLAVCSRRIPKLRDKTYDLEALNGALATIKNKFSGSDTVMLVPDDDLSFDTIVALLDAARVWRKAERSRMPLYPNVILSHLAE
jgi:biopolymer transport protein ExbD